LSLFFNSAIIASADVAPLLKMSVMLAAVPLANALRSRSIDV